MVVHLADRPISDPGSDRESGLWVNDIHARLNRTRVARILRPTGIEELQHTVRRAAEAGKPISLAGGRHAMGGQQFGHDSWLVDMTGMNRVIEFEAEHGLVEVEAGIQWPELIDHLVQAQRGRETAWGIIQKQTGADRLSIGGALAANIHGRGLALRPFVADIESFVLIGPDGRARTCSRSENAELFRLAVGGYGLFGIVATVKLRLAPRRLLRREVEIIDIGDLPGAFEGRIAEGCLYGDFQFSSDETSEGFLRQGVFSCYRPCDPEVAPPAEEQAQLSEGDWRRLLHLAHSDRRRAFEAYTGYYLSTSGQLYWSDTHQLSTYIDDYHLELDRQLGATVPASEMITEVYVPRPALVGFMARVRADFLEHQIPFIYGTVRLIERDEESFLAWAREPYACIIFNLHVEHSGPGIAKATADFRRLIDRAIEQGGSYYLTYHRWATRRQVEACHPRFRAFLGMKSRYDPEERFQSGWYRHHRSMFSEAP